MLGVDPQLIEEARARFAHVESCPFAGKRIFFENAGGALTLKSVVERSAEFAAIPDNPGRANAAGQGLVDIIAKGRADAALFLGAADGQIIVGESGTELLFRLISVAAMGSAPGGVVMGSTIEHPATRSACARWCELSGKPYVSVPHNAASGGVTAQDYAPLIQPDTRVATILHCSPVSGVGVDVAAIAREIRAVAPECFIIVDGIQRAAHGGLDVSGYGADAYVISPYKAFSRHGYGLAWVSDRLSALPKNMLLGGPETNWELGTRDAGAYATFSEVAAYYEWLGGRLGAGADRRERIEAAGAAIHKHEKDLTEAMLHGVGNQAGLAALPGVTVIGGVDNPHREGLVSFALEGRPAEELVAELNARGVRTHTRKADHYSGNVLIPLELDSCVRVSMCHYNTEAEVAVFLSAMREIAES